MLSRKWSHFLSAGRARTLSLLLLAACGDATSSSFANLSATNNADSFLFIGQTFGRPTTTVLRYTWGHTSTVAQISTGLEGGAAILGTARVLVRDAAGTEVYARDLKTNGVDTTAWGTPGDWTIDLTFAGANGDVVFQAVKSPRTLTVTNLTEGPPLTRDAEFTVTLDGTSSQAMSANGSVTYTAVTPGNHTVMLAGVAGNCTVAGSNAQTLSVPASLGATASYTITCT
jgi:hypothetical protein